MKITKFNELSTTVNIFTVTEPATEKQYNIHIHSSVANIGPLKDFICNELYLTDSDPEHHVLVGVGRKAFIGDEFDTDDDMLAELMKIVQDELAGAIERFEAIIACKENSQIPCLHDALEDEDEEYNLIASVFSKKEKDDEGDNYNYNEDIFIDDDDDDYNYNEDIFIDDDDFDDNGSHKEYIYQGICYPSLHTLCEATGSSLYVVEKRLDKKWPLAEAIEIPDRVGIELLYIGLDGKPYFSVEPPLTKEEILKMFR